jgi:hypothetical protein
MLFNLSITPNANQTPIPTAAIIDSRLRIGIETDVFSDIFINLI